MGREHSPGGRVRSPERLAYADAPGLERGPGPNEAPVVFENPRAPPRS